MMKRLIQAVAFTLAICSGLLVGGWLTGDVSAQTAIRIFGTLSGAAKAIAVDSTGRLRVAIEGGGAAFTSAVSIVIDAIGVTSTDGLTIENNTAAAAGAQQWSPRTCWEGQGWKTDATAASQPVEFCLETQTVQGTSAPTGNFVLKVSINGGAFSDVLVCSSASQCIATSVVIGAATTSGCLFDVSGGVLRIREGDNSGDCPASALSVVASSTGAPATPSLRGPDTQGIYFPFTGYVSFTTGGAGGWIGEFDPSGVFALGSSIRFAWQGSSGGATNTEITRAADGGINIGNSNLTNKITIQTADWGTTLSAESVSVANDAALTLGTASLGQLVVTIGTTNTVCRFTLRGSSNAALIDDDGDTGGGAVCTITKDNASTLNVYYDTTGYFLQNKLGGTRAVRVALIGG